MNVVLAVLVPAGIVTVVGLTVPRLVLLLFKLTLTEFAPAMF